MNMNLLTPEHARIAEEARVRIRAEITKKSVKDVVESPSTEQTVQRDEIDALPVAS